MTLQLGSQEEVRALIIHTEAALQRHISDAHTHKCRYPNVEKPFHNEIEMCRNLLHKLHTARHEMESKQAGLPVEGGGVS